MRSIAGNSEFQVFIGVFSFKILKKLIHLVADFNGVGAALFFYRKTDSRNTVDAGQFGAFLVPVNHSGDVLYFDG